MQFINNVLTSLIVRAQSREEGQTLVEYGLIIALVSVALVAALGLLADDIEGVFTSAGNSLNP